MCSALASYHACRHGPNSARSGATPVKASRAAQHRRQKNRPEAAPVHRQSELARLHAAITSDGSRPVLICASTLDTCGPANTSAAASQQWPPNMGPHVSDPTPTGKKRLGRPRHEPLDRDRVGISHLGADHTSFRINARLGQFRAGFHPSRAGFNQFRTVSGQDSALFGLCSTEFGLALKAGFGQTGAGFDKIRAQFDHVQDGRKPHDGRLMSSRIPDSNPNLVEPGSATVKSKSASPSSDFDKNGRHRHDQARDRVNRLSNIKWCRWDRCLSESDPCEANPGTSLGNTPLFRARGTLVRPPMLADKHHSPEVAQALRCISAANLSICAVLAMSARFALRFICTSNSSTCATVGTNLASTLGLAASGGATEYMMEV